MRYKVIGIMSGSSLDGLDLAYVHLNENGGKWQFEILATSCIPYDPALKQQLRDATALDAKAYLLLHTSYGHYIGRAVLRFIEDKQLHHQVDLIASHGHTTFHLPSCKMTAQLGDGAAIAAVTGLPVISDLRALDIALGGQGAPIVPIGERYLLQEYPLQLNIGGIANISFHGPDHTVAFDICPANRVLNMLAEALHLEYDKDGLIASGGDIDQDLLDRLNALDYYSRPFPKSLANDFTHEVILPLIDHFGIPARHALRTYTEHIAWQTARAIGLLEPAGSQLLVTGGGAYNKFLVERLQACLATLNIQVIIPEASLVAFKEALIMAFIGTLRWREENTTLADTTGALRNSIGGALWMGHEY